VKLIMENWRGFLNEHDGAGPLGNHAWPGDRADQSGPMVDEEDTNKEKLLRKTLTNHFTGVRKMSRAESYYILKLVHNQLYPEIFKSYSDGLVYRGMRLPKDKFVELYGPIPKRSSFFKAPIDWWLNRRVKEKGVFSPTTRPGYKHAGSDQALKLIIKPKADSAYFDPDSSVASSWTKNEKFAKKAARRDHLLARSTEADTVDVLFSAEAGENEFIDAEPFYAYDWASDHMDQEEVIGIGNIKLKDITIIRGA